jgi:predicted esterase
VRKTVRFLRLSGIFIAVGMSLLLCGDGGNQPAGSTPSIAGGPFYHAPTNDIKYSYYYYIPESALQRNPVRILLYAHSSPKFDRYTQMEEYVCNVEIPRIKPYCEKYGYAAVIMVTPRNFGPCPDYKMNTQSMVKWTMFDNQWDKPDYEFYKRPDLVFVKVIDEFIEYLRSNGYKPYSKVFMTGFSNGGMQSNRLPILQPNRIAATAIGAAGAFLYPLNSFKGTTLNYPVGVNDVALIAGSSYSLNAFKKIPHFVFVGICDNNDPVPNDDCYDSDEADIINANFGSKPVARAQRFSSYLKSIGMRADWKLYTVCHDYTEEMLEDTFKFFDSVSTPLASSADIQSQRKKQRVIRICSGSS